ncbi:DnaJ [Musa troglodytarum]|uniref:DnaJ n=1 Tax=Musa troglodytarum TaxID=320322 RepID=A0A9E7FSC4_9LILI|nr:DnaJ [Musa troglodytarum]
MDRINLGHGNAGPRSSLGEAFDGGFASPAPFFPSPYLPSVSGPGKPSTPAGLSRPRLVKSRKQIASPQVRAAVITDAEDGSGFNPFRSSMGVTPSGAPERNEGGGLQGLHETLHGWKPFDPKAGEKMSGNTKSGSFVSVEHEIHAGASVFQSGEEKISGTGRSTGEDSMRLEFAGCESKPAMSNLGSGNTVDCTYHFGRDDAGVFASGSAMKENATSGQTLPEDSCVPSLDNFVSVESGSSGFAFGRVSLSNLNMENIGSQNKASNLGVFPFGCDVTKSTESHQISTAGTSYPELGSFEFEKSESVPFVSELNDDSSNTGSDKISGNPSAFKDEQCVDSVSSTYASVSGLNKSDTLSRNKPQNSGVPSVGTFLPAKPENAFVFGANSGNSDSRNSVSMSNTGMFTDERSGSSDAYDTGVQRSSNSSKKSFSVSDKDLFSGLHGEMRKLNLHNSGDDDASKGRKQAYERAKDNVGNSFLFGGNMTTLSSLSGSDVNTLSEEMKKATIGSTMPSHNVRNESVDNPEGFFVFGSNMKKSFTSSQTSTMSEKSFPSKIINVMQKLSIGDFEDDGNFSRSKDADCQFKGVDTANDPDKFIYAGDPKVFSSFDGNAVNTLYNDIKMLNVRDKTENSDANAERTRNVFPNASASSKHTFGVSNQEKSSTGDDFRSYKADSDFRPREYAEPSIHRSSSGHDPRSVETGFNFTSMQEEVGISHMEFRSPKSVAPGLSKESLFTGPRSNMIFSGRKGESKGTKTKKRNGKPKHSIPLQQTFAQTFVSVEKVLEGKDPESLDGYSPMDYSPYQENLVAIQSSIPSNESIHIASPGASIATEKPIPVYESEFLVSATEHLYIAEDDLTHEKPNHNNSRCHDESECLVSATKRLDINEDDLTHGERDHNDSSDHLDKERCEPDGKKVVSKSEYRDLSCGSSSSLMETETDLFGSDIVTQAGENGTSLTSASSLAGFGGSNFAFGATSFAQDPLSASKRQHRRKSRTKVGQEMLNPSLNADVPFVSPFANMLPATCSSVHPDLARDLKSIQSGPQNVVDTRIETGTKPEVLRDPVTTDSEIVAEQEACERWRLRGNQAYAKGLLLKAEEYYTQGVNSVSRKEISLSYNRALMLCYSNRAAARMSLGRMREALNDCMLAAAIDSHFLRVQVRAANCHLALGEIDEAMKYFRKCLLSERDGSLDQKILIEASDGLQKAQQVADYVVQCEELLLKRTSNEVAKALHMISDSLSICTHSEKLMEMKAEALLLLRRYEEVIQFCEQTMEHAERNVLSGTNVQLSKVDNFEDIQVISMRIWRWRLMSESNFYLGRLDEAHDLLKKQDKVKNIVDKNSSGPSGSSISSFVTVSELLRLKAAGNESFKEGRHVDAIEHYSAALACSTESRPFAAICFCNRAAAYQALGQIADAIADCSLAIALDPSYLKAISRRATLHEMIRDYGQASNDLHRLISLLEKQLKDKDNQDGALERSISNNSDLSQACLRLSTVEEESRKEIPLDMYMILGIEPSSSAADVKKAYRKAALRHHPDKAGQLLARSENLDDGVWREMAEEVHRHADRLFKMIGEAYSVLSDPSKRLQYDADEEMRTALRRGYATSSTPKAPADNCVSQFDKSMNRRQRQTYRSSHHRWSESSQSKR